MKRGLVLAFLLPVLLEAAPHPVVDRTLSLEETVRLAINNSQMLLSAREEAQIAFQRVQQAEAQFYPKLDLNANWSKFGVDGDTPLMLQPSLGPTLVPNNPHENYYTVRANILQTIYEGGRGRNTWRQARIAYERARNIQETAQIQVVSTAKQAFYDVLLAQSRRKLWEDALAEGEHDAARSLSAIERLRMQRWRSGIRTQASDAAQQENEARLAFLRALNLELGTQVSLEGTLRTEPVDYDLQKLLAWAGRYRSELRQTEYQQEFDALGIRLSLAERTPRITLGASYERTGYDVDLQTVNWAGTLNVNLPLSVSDIIFGWAKVRERRAQYRQATLRHADVEDVIEKQVRQAYADYRFWQAEIPLRDAERRRTADLAAVVRRAHAATPELWEARVYDVEAEVRTLEAMHGHLASLAALERAVGRSLSEIQ